MESIKNFLTIAADLHCGGQPSEQQLGVLKERGVHVVVNLGLHDTDYALANERTAVESLGMRYVHIPVDFKAPSNRAFKQFCVTLDASRGSRVFVHCALNYRGTSFVALYAQRSLGWRIERADAVRTRFWTPDETWENWAADIRVELST